MKLGRSLPTLISFLIAVAALFVLPLRNQICARSTKSIEGPRFYPIFPKELSTTLLKTASLLLLLLPSSTRAQSTATLQGTIFDPAKSVVQDATIVATNLATHFEHSARTNEQGYYQIAALPPGDYRVKVQATGFRTEVIERLTLNVSGSALQNFQLSVGSLTQEVTVTSANSSLEATTISVGQVVDRRFVHEIPLNGRYFLDLALLVPGSVTPPQSGSATIPVRGLGAFAFNTAGNREESVNYMINGISLNDPGFPSINFQPSISSIQEFKIDNSTLSAEYGQNSGAVVNIGTRSGANEFHGELFDFLRNDAFDARNFFDLNSSEPPPFKRNLFGVNLGGPVIRKKTFFFTSYEGLRQRQGLTLNSVVLSDAERASVTDPTIRRLIDLIPRANFIDSAGTFRFVSPATAPVDLDQWTLDVIHKLSEADRFHLYYAFNYRDFLEPTRGSGNTIPGFGASHASTRHFMSLNYMHTFGYDAVNEGRFGFNTLSANTHARAQLNPADFGILDGINQPIGLPQISVAGGLDFGGPSNLPQERRDTYFVFSDTLTWQLRRHSLKLGGDYRVYLADVLRQGPGAFNFPTVAEFIAGNASSFSVTLGNQSSSINQKALGFFLQDNYQLRPNLMLELGLRYEWNITPTERFNRFIVFDPESASLLRIGEGIDQIYHQNNKNFQPRLGFAWYPISDGKTVVRGGYAFLVDQPPTSVVSPTSANPPLGIPLSFTGSIRLDNAINLAAPAGLAPQSVDHGFDNAYLQSWNLNLQRELNRNLVLGFGYFGSRGGHLIIRRNINQPVNGVRPYPALSAASPILPNTPLGNITQVESSGNSDYHALWVTANHRLTNGVQFSVSYTLSKSLDYNSLSTQGIVVQNSYDLAGDRGLSDFDARHRVVLSGVYDLPFQGNQAIAGWQIATIVQCQSGNPVKIVTSNIAVNGVPNTVRPNVNGPVAILGQVDAWFDTSAFTAVNGFGNLGRNVLIGPRFDNVDFSIIKHFKLNERMSAQFRSEIFDLFNHPNFGQPGNIVGTPAFGRITNTRFSTGESGSSRQIQFALKLMF